MYRHFPRHAMCPLCGTNKQGISTMIDVDGSQGDGGTLCEGRPAHVACLTDGRSWRMSEGLGLIYAPVMRRARC